MAFPSTYKTIQDGVIAKLGLDATADLAKVKDWINQAYADAAVETEALQTDGTMTLIPNCASYSFPSTIARVKYIVAAPSSAKTSYGAPLKQVTLDELLQYRQSNPTTTSSTGTVECYAFAGMNQIEFYPTPSNADVTAWWFVYLPTTLTADGDVPIFQEPWNTELLEYGAATKGGEFLQHPSTETYRLMYRDALSRFRIHINRRSGGGPRQIPMLRPVLFLPQDRSMDVVASGY